MVYGIKGKSGKAENKNKYLFLLVFASSLFLFGFIFDSPQRIIEGLGDIILSRDTLITDYIKIGGIGASFVNAGLLTLLFIALLYFLRINLNGTAFAVIFSMAGFALFGKNIVNVWFVIIGVFLYTLVQREKFSKYVYIALFGTAMAPVTSEFILTSALPFYVALALGILIGVFIGFILPPLSSHMLKMHQGYNLYNIGFTAGIITTVLVALLKSFGYLPELRLEVSSGNNLAFAVYLYSLFLFFILLGIKDIKNYFKILTYTGRLVSDFLTLEGSRVTYINMGLNGMIVTSYVLLLNGQLNGPTLGGIFTVVGFSAFGKHPKNILPVLAGVLIGALITKYTVNDTIVMLAALFGTALAPIAGEYGIFFGILAGFIHLSVVVSIVSFHGGLNLYNNGFSAGIVASVMVPVIEAFRKDDTD